MSSITGKRLCIWILAAALSALGGCGSPNSTATYDPETMVHNVNWLPAGHVGPAQEDINWCASCHGTNLDGGISKVSCTTCHLGGPLAVHPAVWQGQPWFQAGAAQQGHGIFVTEQGTSSCRNIWCHGANLQGVALSGPACAKCHPGEAF